MSGSQKGIYDNSKQFLNEQNANFSDLTGDEVQQVKDILADPECFKGNKMQKIKGLVDSLKEQVASLLEKEKQQALTILHGLRDELSGMVDFSLLDESRQSELLNAFADFEQKLDSQKIIAVIQQSIGNFKENNFLQLLSKKDRWLAEKAENDKPDDYEKPKDDENKKSSKSKTNEKKPEYISKNRISINFNKSILENETDVDAYVEAIQEAYLAAVKQGKRVQI